MIFKCRASAAGNIMTDPKSGTGLSVTCKDYVRQQWIADTYSREQDYTSRPIQKGLMNEEQGITMLSKYLGEMLVKNEKRYEDDHCTGTPDILHEDSVFDVKCSYSIWTFAKAEATKQYDYQLQVYMNLTGIHEAALVYVLTDTPMSIIQGEVKSICWKLQNDDDALEIEAGLIKELTYPDIPMKDRIKIIPVVYDQSKIEALHSRVEQCREFYNKLTL